MLKKKINYYRHLLPINFQKIELLKGHKLYLLAAGKEDKLLE